jgi:hypothetical protein
MCLSVRNKDERHDILFRDTASTSSQTKLGVQIFLIDDIQDT